MNSKITRTIAFSVLAVIALTGVLGAYLYNETGNVDHFLAQVSGKPVNETRGIWLTDTDSQVLRDGSYDKMVELLKKLEAQGFNTIYPDVWGKGIIFYDGEVGSESLNNTSVYRDPKTYKGDFMRNLSMAMVGNRFKNMQLVPWFEYGLMVPMKSDIAIKNGDWLLQKADGGRSRIAGGVEMGYLNPLKPEVKDLFKKIIADLYVNYAIDGIAFDDQLCWPKELSYDPYTVNVYAQENKGKLPPTNPADAGFMRWKADKLTAFIKEAIADGLKEAMKLNRMPLAEPRGIIDPKAPGGKRPFISISQNNFPWSYDNYSQDWPQWMEKGLIDEFTLQNYKTDPATFASTLDNQSKYWDKYKAKIPITVAILSGVGTKIVNMDALVEMIKYSRKKGMAGFAIFYYQSLQNELPKGQNAAKFKTVMGTPAVPVIRKL
jgi:uncharacterized lipoprotein YddW (UPF0748 family)